jgi:hypothetical protein
MVLNCESDLIIQHNTRKTYEVNLYLKLPLKSFTLKYISGYFNLENQV